MNTIGISRIPAQDRVRRKTQEKNQMLSSLLTGIMPQVGHDPQSLSQRRLRITAHVKSSISPDTFRPGNGTPPDSTKSPQKAKARGTLIPRASTESRGSGLNRRPAHYEWLLGGLRTSGSFPHDGVVVGKEGISKGR